MSDEWSAYTEDPRIPCKYGSKCYQRNPNHHSTYKHPPQTKKVTEKRARKRFSPYSRDINDDKSKIQTKEDVVAHVPDEKVANDDKSEIETKEDEFAHSLQKDANKTSGETSEITISKLPKDVTYYENSEYAALQELFLVEMPKDFFKFYEILNEDGAIVKTLEKVKLELIGPYDLLLGNLPKVDDKEQYLVHWRFFYDPPEFQAVLKKKGKSEFHIGYFRDSPNEKPVFVGSNDSTKDCHITILADNIFGAVYQFLQKEKAASPFAVLACQKLMDKIKKCAEENDFTISPFNLKKRKAEQVANTLHHAGIVVPYDKKTKLGYRPLVENDVNLKKIFTELKAAKTQADKDKLLSELQPVITYASIALDEYDFGTGLELGIDLFCSGIKELEPSALSSLCSTYPLLNREAFAKIIQAHLKHRRKGPNMSISM